MPSSIETRRKVEAGLARQGEEELLLVPVHRLSRNVLGDEEADGTALGVDGNQQDRARVEHLLQFRRKGARDLLLFRCHVR